MRHALIFCIVLGSSIGCQTTRSHEFDVKYLTLTGHPIEVTINEPVQPLKGIAGFQFGRTGVTEVNGTKHVIGVYRSRNHSQGDKINVVPIFVEESMYNNAVDQLIGTKPKPAP
jgi:hypothetical protein